MKVGIITSNEVQLAVFSELLAPLVGEIKHIEIAQAQAGELERCILDILVVDMNDPAVVNCPEVITAICQEDPICLLHDKELHTMTPMAKLAWRNRTLDEIKKAVPEGAKKLDELRDQADNKNLPDVWIIGSSSGGPQALKQLFTALPPLPISILVAQHMSADGYGQLLDRVSNLAKGWEVHSAQDGMRVLPRTVYLVPRDNTIEISGGIISLQPSSTNVSFNPSIDTVIRSVSQCHQNVGVIILSGMGADGSGGIRAIKGKAMMIMAQDHVSSGAKSMPDSARNTGAVQYSAPPDLLAKRLEEIYSV